jgi:hypothetical protein
MRAWPAAILLLDVARLWRDHRVTLVADFRREYGISWGDLSRLPAVEWAQLTLGLSRRSRTIEAMSDPKRRQQRSVETPRTPEQYVRSARRLRGKVHVVQQPGGPTV